MPDRCATDRTILEYEGIRGTQRALNEGRGDFHNKFLGAAGVHIWIHALICPAYTVSITNSQTLSNRCDRRYANPRFILTRRYRSPWKRHVIAQSEKLHATRQLNFTGKILGKILGIYRVSLERPREEITLSAMFAGRRKFAGILTGQSCN